MTLRFTATILEQRVTATTATLLCLHAGMRLFSVGALINLTTEKSGGSWPGIYTYTKHSLDTWHTFAGPSSAVYAMVSALLGTHFAQQLQVGRHKSIHLRHSKVPIVFLIGV